MEIFILPAIFLLLAYMFIANVLLNNKIKNVESTIEDLGRVILDKQKEAVTDISGYICSTKECISFISEDINKFHNEIENVIKEEVENIIKYNDKRFKEFIIDVAKGFTDSKEYTKQIAEESHHDIVKWISDSRKNIIDTINKSDIDLGRIIHGELNASNKHINDINNALFISIKSCMENNNINGKNNTHILLNATKQYFSCLNSYLYAMRKSLKIKDEDIDKFLLEYFVGQKEEVDTKPKSQFLSEKDIEEILATLRAKEQLEKAKDSNNDDDEYTKNGYKASASDRKRFKQPKKPIVTHSNNERKDGDVVDIPIGNGIIVRVIHSSTFDEVK